MSDLSPRDRLVRLASRIDDHPTLAEVEEMLICCAEMGESGSDLVDSLLDMRALLVSQA